MWYFGNWQSMHLMVVTLLAVAMLVVHVTMRRHYRDAYKAVYPKLPELWRMVKKRQTKA